MAGMQAKLEVSSKTFLLHSVVHGHHIFKNIWTPNVGEILTLQQETGDRHDTCRFILTSRSVHPYFALCAVHVLLSRHVGSKFGEQGCWA